MSDRVRVMDAAAIQRARTRIAHEILERNVRLDSLSLVGIRTLFAVDESKSARED